MRRLALAPAPAPGTPSHGWGNSPRHLLTLGALRQGLLSLSTSARAVAQEPDFALAEAVHLINFYVVPLANRRALTALLAELDEQLAATRNLTEEASAARSPKALDQVRRQLVTTGLESQLVANDIAAFARDEQSWKHEFFDFSLVLPAALTASPDQGNDVPGVRASRSHWGIRLRRGTKAEKGSSQRGDVGTQEQASAAGKASLAESLRQARSSAVPLLPKAKQGSGN